MAQLLPAYTPTSYRKINKFNPKVELYDGQEFVITKEHDQLDLEDADLAASSPLHLCKALLFALLDWMSVVAIVLELHELCLMQDYSQGDCICLYRVTRVNLFTGSVMCATSVKQLLSRTTNTHPRLSMLVVPLWFGQLGLEQEHLAVVLHWVGSSHQLRPLCQ